MADNRGILAKWLERRVKLSCGPFKLRFWSIDRTDRGLTRPDCTNNFCLYFRDIISPGCMSTEELTGSDNPGSTDNGNLAGICSLGSVDNGEVTRMGFNTLWTV